MKTRIKNPLLSILSLLLACSAGHASYQHQQDNWYLADEWSVSGAKGVFYHENNVTGIGQIYVCNGNGGTNARVSVYDMNGSLDRHITIANARYDPTDLVLDQNGTIYIAERYAVTCLANDGTFRWRVGKNASISNFGTQGSGNGEFLDNEGICIGADRNLYIADDDNHRIQVLDRNGLFIRKFGSQGTAPGNLNYPRGIAFLPDQTLVVGDANGINFFKSDGTFIERGSWGEYRLSTSADGLIWNAEILRNKKGNLVGNLQNQGTRGSYSAFFKDGGLILSGNSYLQIWKRAYRTKGLTTPNAIPQPAIRGISQRTGTNILDLDFEILDSDDTTATVGILAYAGSTRIVPQAWTDGTQYKIGTPIATNQVHRVSWDVKQDWATNTGTIKFEILCQDARRTKPVDLHFLTLPLSDGNLTISRSFLMDYDYLNFFKYQVSIGSNEVAWNGATNEWTDGSSTTYMNSSSQVTDDGRTYLMGKLGYRYATSTEVTKAREAATPGSVNRWPSYRKVSINKNRLISVNEFGFDTTSESWLSGSIGRHWWVVKE